MCGQDTDDRAFAQWVNTGEWIRAAALGSELAKVAFLAGRRSVLGDLTEPDLPATARCTMCDRVRDAGAGWQTRPSGDGSMAALLCDECAPLVPHDGQASTGSEPVNAGQVTREPLTRGEVCDGHR